MRGITHLRVGTYKLTPDLTFAVRASDEGTVISINHEPSNLRVIAVIDEHGTVVPRPIRDQITFQHSTPTSSPSSESPVPFDDDGKDSRIEVLDTPRSPPPTPKRKPKLIRFTLRFNAKCHPQSRPYALVGYTDGDVVHVLYRTSAGRNGYTDRHLRIADGRISIASQINASYRVTKSEWAEILAMSAGTTFQVAGHLPMWQVMTNDELRSHMEEQTFRVVHKPISHPTKVQPSPVPAPCTSQARPKFKTRHVSILRCEPANFDHAEGEPATAITVAHEHSIEPLTIGLDDTRKLVVHLLISLWTADDSFAEEALAKFPIGDDGVHHWPKQD